MYDSVVNLDSDARRSVEYPCILLVTLLTFMGFYCPQPLLASIARTFGTSRPVAGLMMTVTIVPFAVAPLLYGRILRRCSPRAALTAALAGTGIFLCLAGRCASFPSMLLCRTMQGLLLPAVLICLTTRLSALYTGRELQTKLAVYAALTMVGAYGGRILAGGVGSLFAPGTALLIFGLLQLCALVPARAVAGSIRADGRAFRPPAVAALLGDGKLCRVLFIGPICIFGYAAVLNFLPFHLYSLDSGMSDLVVGLVYVVGLASACVALFSGRLLRALGHEWNLLLFGMVLFCLFLPLFLTRSLGLNATAMLGTSVAFSLIYGNSPGLVNRVSVHDGYVTNSLYLSVYYLFSAVGSVIPVMVYDCLGVQYFVGMLLMVVAIDTCIILHARRSVRFS